MWYVGVMADDAYIPIAHGQSGPNPLAPYFDPYAHFVSPHHDFLDSGIYKVYQGYPDPGYNLLPDHDVVVTKVRHKLMSVEVRAALRRRGETIAGGDLRVWVYEGDYYKGGGIACSELTFSIQGSTLVSGFADHPGIYVCRSERPMIAHSAATLSLLIQ